MSMKSKSKKQFFIETLDTHTNNFIRKAIAETGGHHEDVVVKILKISGESKTGLTVSKSVLEYMKSSKDQILGGPLKYNIFEVSKNGDFLNLPRESFKKKKGDSKAQSENKRMNKQIQDMVKNRAK